MRENRVLTVHTNLPNHKKEFGEIGFHQEAGAVYLLFPKPLPPKQPARIVGINFQLTLDPPVSRAEAAAPPPKKSPPKSKILPEPREAPSRPPLKTFKVVLRRTISRNEVRTIRAVTETEARKKAKSFVKSTGSEKVEVLDVT